MDRIIKLTDAKVPKSFRPKRQKSKNLNQVQKSTDEEAKISKRGRKRKEQNAKIQPDPQPSSSSKRRKKSRNVTDGRSEVQIELEKLNNQLRYVVLSCTCFTKILIVVILIKICRIHVKNFGSNIIMALKLV